MGILSDHKVLSVYHYAPLHYLPFIARSRFLLTKPSIQRQGFPSRHFRSKSNFQDIARGFGSYAFLTLDSQPRILSAKLAAGFPHIQLKVPAEVVDTCEFSLCRFNVAMTRHLRRDGKPGFPESASNGRYYGQHQIPIARTNQDKAAMLQRHLGNTMIEVLTHGDFPLPDETTIVCFSKADGGMAERVLAAVGSPWATVTASPPSAYPKNSKHLKAVGDFIEHALFDPKWQGDGLEFDRL